MLVRCMFELMHLFFGRAPDSLMLACKPVRRRTVSIRAAKRAPGAPDTALRCRGAARVSVGVQFGLRDSFPVF